MRKYVVEVEVKTPVHIWSGEYLFFGIDLVEYGGEVYCINTNKLLSIIAEKGGLNALLNIADLRELNTLSIMRRYGITFYDVQAYKIETPKHIIPLLRKYVKVRKPTYIGGKAGIPGSSIKGLIRTAILNKIVSQKYIDHKSMERIILGILRQKRLFGAGRNIEKYLVVVLEKISEKTHSIMKKRIDLLHLIQVSDPIESMSKTILDIIKVYGRTKINELETIAEEPFIALAKNSKFVHELIVYEPLDEKKITDKSIRNQYSSFFEKMYDSFLREQVFLSMLKEFSLKTMEYEYNHLKELFMRKHRLDPTNFIKKLEKWISEVRSNNNIFYFKIGYGAGMPFKTIYLSLDPKLKNLLINVASKKIRQQTRGRITIWDTLSIKLVGSSAQNNIVEPLGWVKLTVARGESNGFTR